MTSIKEVFDPSSLRWPPLSHVQWPHMAQKV